MGYRNPLHAQKETEKVNAPPRTRSDTSRKHTHISINAQTHTCYCYKLVRAVYIVPCAVRVSCAVCMSVRIHTAKYMCICVQFLHAGRRSNKYLDPSPKMYIVPLRLTAATSAILTLFIILFPCTHVIFAGGLWVVIVVVVVVVVVIVVVVVVVVAVAVFVVVVVCVVVTEVAVTVVVTCVGSTFKDATEHRDALVAQRSVPGMKPKHTTPKTMGQDGYAQHVSCY